MQENKPNNASLSQDSEKLGKASFGAMAGVIFSRASGVIRTAVVNATFGLNVSLDAFNTAFRFPNSLRDLFADGALSAAFVKVLVEEKAKGLEAEKKLIKVVLGFFSIVTFFIAILSSFFSYKFISIFASESFEKSGGLELASNLFKILAFFLPFTMLNAVAMAVLSTLGSTFRAMNSSLFFNFGMIFSALLSPFMLLLNINPIYALAIGALLGVFLQMIYQFFPLYKLGLIDFPVFNIKVWLKYSPLHQILLLMVPRTIAQGSLIIALMINTFFAIQLGEGVFSYIVTATIIIQVPIGLFGVATGFAAHPILTKAIFEGQNRKFSKLLIESLDSTLWLSLITLLCFSLLIVPFYSVLFQHGKVTTFDTLQNSIAVCSYSIGIIFAAGTKVLLNAYYAINCTKQIVYNSFVYLIINALLTATLAPKFGIIGLGISYSTATAIDFFMNLFFLKWYYQKKFIGDSPYIEGGRFFYFKIFIFAFFSYIIGIFGIFMVYNFWENFDSFFSFKFNFINNLLIICVFGSLILGFSLLLIYKIGPYNLKKLINKIFEKIK